MCIHIYIYIYTHTLNNVDNNNNDNHNSNNNTSNKLAWLDLGSPKSPQSGHLARFGHAP